MQNVFEKIETKMMIEKIRMCFKLWELTCPKEKYDVMKGLLIFVLENSN